MQEPPLEPPREPPLEPPRHVTVLCYHMAMRGRVPFAVSHYLMPLNAAASVLGCVGWDDMGMG